MPRKKKTETPPQADPAIAQAAQAAEEPTLADMFAEDDSSEEQTGPHVLERVVVFYLDGQRYALPIERIQEIQQIVAFSAVPGGGMGIVGMVNLRGTVIPAVDMRSLVGLPTREYTLETPMIICETGTRHVALIVDEVEDVIAMSPDELQVPPAMHSLSGKMIGVARFGDGLVYVLDLDLLLGPGFSGMGG